MTEPAEAGRELEKPETMTDEDNDSDALKREINKILPGDEPLFNLRSIQTGPAHYTVLSGRNGNVSTHRVDVQAVECSCEDMTFNTSLNSQGEGGREVCAHIAHCMLEHPQLEPEAQGLMKYFGLLDNADRLGERLSEEMDVLDGLIVDLREAKAHTGNGDASRPDNESQAVASVDPSKAADNLRDAYNDVVEDMNVQHSDGWVWVQTGKDTPETLPGPGNVQVFEAFLQNAYQVEYIHDDHEDVDMKPGQWWKNRIDPADVDDYISEVLK